MLEQYRKKNRLENYDYSLIGSYFVTICTHDRLCWFGEIKNRNMILNEFGTIAYKQFQWLAIQYPYAQLDAFVVMPNHVHAVVVIDPTNSPGRRDRSRPAPTMHTEIPTGIQPRTAETITNGNTLSLSNIVGAYKTTTSKLIHQSGYPEFAWQRSFHDHIIRNEIELTKIRQYIERNPLRWWRDRNKMDV